VELKCYSVRDGPGHQAGRVTMGMRLQSHLKKKRRRRTAHRGFTERENKTIKIKSKALEGPRSMTVTTLWARRVSDVCESE
jgi:hypothetical protein